MPIIESPIHPSESPEHQSEQRATSEPVDIFKVGGTTIGTITLGGAIGNLLGPAGTVAGAVLGGLLGLVLSTGPHKK
jgi:hypothetical protein